MGVTEECPPQPSGLQRTGTAFHRASLQLLTSLFRPQEWNVRASLTASPSTGGVGPAAPGTLSRTCVRKDGRKIPDRGSL